ncbi:hypothetical protein ABPG74_018259 [Tetrahymena malaccensis]
MQFDMRYYNPNSSLKYRILLQNKCIVLHFIIQIPVTLHNMSLLNYQFPIINTQKINEQILIIEISVCRMVLLDNFFYEFLHLKMKRLLGFIKECNQDWQYKIDRDLHLYIYIINQIQIIKIQQNTNIVRVQFVGFLFYGLFKGNQSQQIILIFDILNQQSKKKARNRVSLQLSKQVYLNCFQKFTHLQLHFACLYQFQIIRYIPLFLFNQQIYQRRSDLISDLV